MATVSQKLNLMRLRRELTDRRLPPPPANVKIPEQASTIQIETIYYRDILVFLDPMIKAVNNILVPRLPDIKQQHAKETKFDAYGDVISAAFGEINLALERQFDHDKLEDDVASIANRTSAHNKTQLKKQFRTVLGVDPVLSEPYLSSQIASFTKRNIHLVESIPDKYLDSLQTKITVGIEQGDSIRTLTKTIASEFDKTDNQAQLIARDQVGKFNGKLNELRQQDAGITHYIWSDSGDIRVRDLHMRLDGKRFSWKKPPVAGTDGVTRLHPGQAIQCRCQALPDFKRIRKALGLAA